MQTFGIIGNPVAHSLSPVFHRMIYKAIGFDGDYSRFHVKENEVKNVISAMKSLGISGINVTSPYKEVIIPYLDELSPEALEIGAVNTVKFSENGAAVGYNTDCHGFAESLLYAGIVIEGKNFAVLGISGAGKAACYALKKYGAAKVVAVSRDQSKGISYSELEKLTDMDVIVNCTTLGMASKEGESPVKREIFANFKAAADMIYNPAETKFLKEAKDAGLKTLNGLPMLVLQGVRSFSVWTEIALDAEIPPKIIDKLTCFLEKNNVY